jgi:eukaryotic-like serine/threonine-protein kinase
LVHYNLGNALYSQRKPADAEAAFRKAIALKPDLAEAYNNLGNALCRQGKLVEGEAEYRKSIALKPDDAFAYYNLGNSLNGQTKLADAEAACRKAIALKPDLAEAYYNLGISLNRQRKYVDAEAAYRKAIEIKPDFAEAHCNLGAVLQRCGRFIESLTVFRRGYELGSKRSDWRYPSLQWVRTAERFVELEDKLPRVFQGEIDPSNAGEAITLAWMCRQPYKKLYAASARLYADAFALDPKLAADLIQHHRYYAACSAVLAAAGQNEDARLVPDEVAAMFRRWALGWLRDHLTAYSKLAEQKNPNQNKTIQQKLAYWRSDPDLASVRDPQALDRLPDNEHATWQALWRDVDELAKKVAEKKP